MTETVFIKKDFYLPLIMAFNQVVSTKIKLDWESKTVQILVDYMNFYGIEPERCTFEGEVLAFSNVFADEKSIFFSVAEGNYIHDCHFSVDAIESIDLSGIESNLVCDPCFINRYFKSLCNSIISINFVHELVGYFYFDALNYERKLSENKKSIFDTACFYIENLTSDHLDSIASFNLSTPAELSMALCSLPYSDDETTDESREMVCKAISGLPLLRCVSDLDDYVLLEDIAVNSLLYNIFDENNQDALLSTFLDNYVLDYSEYRIRYDALYQAVKGLEIAVSVRRFIDSNIHKISKDLEKTKYRKVLGDIDEVKAIKYIKSIMAEESVVEAEIVGMVCKNCSSSILKVIFRYSNSTASNSISNLDAGLRYEEYVLSLYKQLAFEASATPSVGDYGIDIIVKDPPNVIGIQCKNYNANVGVDAVMQCYSGAKFYDCDRYLLISSSGFTESAVEMAKKLNVQLKVIKFRNNLNEHAT